MRLVDRRHLLPGAAAFAAALLVALLGLNAGADEPRPAEPPFGPVELQLLGVNDFHGHLEPPAPGLGGAAWLGAWLDRAESTHRGRTIRVHAGDIVGASPLISSHFKDEPTISSHFKDEPTIEATNLMEFDVGTLGNHAGDVPARAQRPEVHDARLSAGARHGRTRHRGSRARARQHR